MIKENGKIILPKCFNLPWKKMGCYKVGDVNDMIKFSCLYLEHYPDAMEKIIYFWKVCEEEFK